MSQPRDLSGTRDAIRRFEGPLLFGVEFGFEGARIPDVNTVRYLKVTCSPTESETAVVASSLFLPSPWPAAWLFQGAQRPTAL